MKEIVLKTFEEEEISELIEYYNVTTGTYTESESQDPDVKGPFEEHMLPFLLKLGISPVTAFSDHPALVKNLDFVKSPLSGSGPYISFSWGDSTGDAQMYFNVALDSITSSQVSKINFYSKENILTVLEKSPGEISDEGEMRKYNFKCHSYASGRRPVDWVFLYLTKIEFIAEPGDLYTVKNEPAFNTNTFYTLTENITTSGIKNGEEIYLINGLPNFRILNKNLNYIAFVDDDPDNREHWGAQEGYHYDESTNMFNYTGTDVIPDLKYFGTNKNTSLQVIYSNEDKGMSTISSNAYKKFRVSNNLLQVISGEGDNEVIEKQYDISNSQVVVFRRSVGATAIAPVENPLKYFINVGEKYRPRDGETPEEYTKRYGGYGWSNFIFSREYTPGIYISNNKIDFGFGSYGESRDWRPRTMGVIFNNVLVRHTGYQYADDWTQKEWDLDPHGFNKVEPDEPNPITIKLACSYNLDYYKLSSGTIKMYDTGLSDGGESFLPLSESSEYYKYISKQDISCDYMDWNAFERLGPSGTPVSQHEYWRNLTPDYDTQCFKENKGFSTWHCGNDINSPRDDYSPKKTTHYFAAKWSNPKIPTVVINNVPTFGVMPALQTMTDTLSGYSGCSFDAATGSLAMTYHRTIDTAATSPALYNFNSNRNVNLINPEGALSAQEEVIINENHHRYNYKRSCWIKNEDSEFNPPYCYWAFDMNLYNTNALNYKAYTVLIIPNE